ncbi:MAG: ABC transporter permease [Acidimicrobiales bacterium]|nr:ABC transporter permease [Acidimicrobiales bacterium]
MFRLGLKNLLAKKRRVASTAFAVLLGVAFLAGALVLTDTIGKTFDDLFAQVNEGVDAQVRSDEVVDSEIGDLRGRIDADLLATVLITDGVAAAEGEVSGFAQLVDPEGDPIGNPGQGAPTLGFSWSDIDELNPLVLEPGSRAPSGPDEVMIDKKSADDADFALGDQVTVLFEGPPQSFEIVGIAKFGDADSPLGASMAIFDLETAQAVLGEPGKFDAIGVVAADGVSQEELRDNLAAALDGANGVEVITGDELIAESQDQVAEALGFFNTFMLVFAGVAVFVGAFIIFNTFSIIVAQRSREMALLRALGASRSQVFGSIQIEAFAVGVVASIAGIGAGVLVASGLKALLAGFGIDIPSSSVVFRTRTVVVSLIVGVGVTMVSSIVPALRASRTPPMAAMRTAAIDTSGRSRIRAVLGVVVTAAGVGAVLAGLFGSGGNGAGLVGLGAALVFLGVAVLGPVIARPFCRLIGAPIRRFRGVAGELAAENAGRNPKRTSATAAALMIGVGLVAFITIFAASAKASINRIVDESFIGDLVVDSGTYAFGGLSPELAERLNGLPEVAAASGVRVGYAEVAGSTDVLYGIDGRHMGEIVDVGVVTGRIEDLGPTDLAVYEKKAEDEGWTIGSTVTVRFAEVGEREFTVALLYTENQLAGNYFISQDAFEAVFPTQLDFQVYVLLRDDADVDQARSKVEGIAADYANADVQDLTEYKQSQADQINQLLGLIYALLALSVLIALIGIANTLALSVVERVHELGLLRAVGMTRRQVRSSVRWESVIISLLGAVLGLAIGIFFGWAVMRALRGEGFEELSIPITQLGVLVILSSVVGVLAAVMPARRAARLDVLRAIAAE